MPRTFNPNDLIALPQLDANGAAALAQSLESAVLDDKGKPRKLPESVRVALEDIAEDRAALQEVLGGAPTPEPILKKEDAREDAAVGALYDLLEAWARLEGEIPEADVAKTLLAHLKADQGLSFINWRPSIEWGAVETRLQTIEREKLDPQFAELGATSMLKHLRKVHVRYGEVTGQTKPLVSSESPKVREKYDTLLGSMRHYVGSVIGSVQRKKPETQELADLLLKPLSDWKSRGPRKKRVKPTEESEGSGGPSGPPRKEPPPEPS